MDLKQLPKVRDSAGFLYVEHCKIEQEGHALALFDASGVANVPCASLLTLMLGPGTSISHAAVRTLVEHGATAIWVGEAGVRCYAQGLGETRSARNLLAQVRRWSDPQQHLAVVRRMYEIRFGELIDDTLTLAQIRGMEGIRVRRAYAQTSLEAGVEWTGRNYQRDDWRQADPVNRALSSANSCLYGICHAAIVSAGYSPALGFIHTGKVLSFVYDIADLYKTEISIPIAFEAARLGTKDVERRTRRACREAFHSKRLLQRIVPDLAQVLGLDESEGAADEFAADAARPGDLWDPAHDTVVGGVNYEPGEDAR